MDKVISALEGIVSDLAFTGLDNIEMDILTRIRKTSAVCAELDMYTAVSLLDKLAENCCIETYGQLCCYTESISAIR